MGFALRAILAGFLLAAPAGAGEWMARLPDGRMLAFSCEGDGASTIILEAGWAAGAGAWQKVVPLLAGRARVCAYDRAGTGRSAPGPMPRTGEAIARDLADGLASLGIAGPFIPVGHSIGGLYVRHLAALIPGRVAGMVLVDPTVPVHPAQFAPFIERATICLGWYRSPPAGREGAPPKGCAVRAPGDPVAVWEARLSELDSLAPPPPLRQVPVVVLAAMRDLEGTAADARRAELQAIAAGVPGGRLIVLPDSGHMVMRDRPDAIAEAVLALLPSPESRGDKGAPGPQPADKGESS